MTKKPVKKPGGAAVKKSLKKTVKTKPLAIKAANAEEFKNLQAAVAPAFSGEPFIGTPGLDEPFTPIDPETGMPVLDGKLPFTWTTGDTLIVIAGVVLGLGAVYFFF